ncbi:hypothetical protein [Metaclostridioides mangenotii]|nr:hypothetical protein [Clostridioides mangenotii]
MSFSAFLYLENVENDMRVDGLILAGGKSSRMGGTHKGSLK